MTLSLPGGADDDPLRQQKFQALAKAMPGFGDKSSEVRYGNSSVTWTAAQNSAATTVTHGLGRIPVAITFGGADGAVKWAWQNKTATTFQIVGRYESAISGSALVDWIAVG